jgi:hypothetical protein
MSKHLSPFFQIALLSLAIVAVFMLPGFMLPGTTTGAEPDLDAAQLDRFTHPDGADYFALSLKPTAAVPTAVAYDVVVLMDTSASQTGPYRTKALAALDALLAGLGPKDQVKLIAVDLNAIPMTEVFVAPDHCRGCRLYGRSGPSAGAGLHRRRDERGELVGHRVIRKVGRRAARRPSEREQLRRRSPPGHAVARRASRRHGR